MNRRCTWRPPPPIKTGSRGEVMPLPSRRPRCKRFTRRPSGLCEEHERRAAAMPEGPYNPDPGRRP